MKQNHVNLGSLLFDLLIDLGLIAMGVALYYHFMVYPLGPVGLSDVFIKLVGSKLWAVLIISSLPFLVGALNLARSILRASRRLRSSPPPAKPAA